MEIKKKYAITRQKQPLSLALPCDSPGVVGDKSLFGDEFKDTRVTAAVTRSGRMGGTVQNVLNR